MSDIQGCHKEIPRVLHADGKRHIPRPIWIISASGAIRVRKLYSSYLCGRQFPLSGKPEKTICMDCARKAGLIW